MALSKKKKKKIKEFYNLVTVFNILYKIKVICDQIRNLKFYLSLPTLKINWCIRLIIKDNHQKWTL